MDNDDLSKAFGSFKNLIDSGQLPDNLKDVLNNFQSSSNSNNSTTESPPETSSDKASSEHNEMNFDIATLLKMKNIISSMNSKNDPRANLLYSLKPYLRDSKKGKLDQYVNLLNMTKVAGLLKNENTEKKDNA